MEPPHAAWTTMAFSNAASVRMSLDLMPRFSAMTRARAERTATSNHAGVPLGDSAAWVMASPRASDTTCDVPAVPRNWQPPPGDAHARHPTSWAYWRVTSPCANRAPMDWIMPASSPVLGARVTPPGTMTTGLSRSPASAIIIAGRPLSQDATPMTPRAVGRDRAWRRNTWAASLRYGRESIMPVVPWVRPSQGSEQNVANGRPLRRSNSLAAALTIDASSKCPVWSPSAMGVPSSSRRPPAVARMMNCLRISSAGFQPIPAFWDMPKWSPLGLLVRKSAVNGTTPAGPSVLVRISRSSADCWVPRTSSGVRSGVWLLPFLLVIVMLSMFVRCGFGGIAA